MSNSIENQIEQLNIDPDDILILKGLWEQEALINLSEIMKIRKMHNIIVVIPDEKSLETMPTDSFYILLKSVEKRRKFDEGSLKFFSETGVLPMRVSESGQIDEPLEEAIICESISGGAEYENEMPEILTLARKTKDGKEYSMRYVQDTEYFDEE